MIRFGRLVTNKLETKSHENKQTIEIINFFFSLVYICLEKKKKEKIFGLKKIDKTSLCEEQGDSER